MNGKIVFLIIFVAMAMVSGCGGADDEELSQAADEKRAAATAEETKQVVAGETPDLEPEESVEATDVPAAATQTAEPSSSPSPSPSPAAEVAEEIEIVYTKDPDPCVRPVPEAFGDAGGALAGTAAARLAAKGMNGRSNFKSAPGDIQLEPAFFGGGGGGQGVQPIVFDEMNDAVLLTLQVHPERVNFADFSYDGRYLVTSNYLEDRVWDVGNPKVVAAFGHGDAFGLPSISDQSPYLAARANGGYVEIWNLDDMEEGPARVAVDVGSNIMSLSPDGQWLAVVDGPVATLWDATSGKEVQHLAGQVHSEGTSADGGTYPAEMANGHAENITALTFSPNGQALFTAGLDDTIRLWDIETGEHLRCLFVDGIEDGYGSLAVSPDGRYLAADSYDLVYIWDAVSGELNGQINAQEGLVQEFAVLSFSPDGERLLAASSVDKMATLWDLESGELAGVLRHPGPVNYAAFNPQGHHIITAIGENYPFAWLWDAEHSHVSLASRTQILIAEGMRQQEMGAFEEMLLLFEEAHNINPDDPALLGARHWNQICWYGSLLGQASNVLPACEMAIKGAAYWGDEPLYRDSRGLARALTGDAEGAIEDFNFFVNFFAEETEYEDRVQLRRTWSEELGQSNDPFDSETLEALLNE